MFKTQNTILSAAVVLAFSGAVTAVLGLIKGRLLVSYFGVSEELSIFYTADKVPNMVYSLLVVGIFSTVFIPLFTEKVLSSKEASWQFASQCINVSVAFFMLLGGTLFILAPLVIRLLSLDKFTPSGIALGANLMRLMLGAQLLLVVSSIFTSMLQSLKYFVVPAIAPVVYNLGMLLGTIFLSDRFGIYGPALGVLLGALFHLLIQLPLLKSLSFKWVPTFTLKDGMRSILVLAPFRLLSVLIANVISVIENTLAIWISTSSVVFLKYANTLQFFPISFFAVSLSAALLPALSSKASNKKEFKRIFLTSLHQMFFLIIPASVMLIILRVPIVRLIYGVSNFPWEATVKTSYVLAFFALSALAQGSVYLLTRAFYALKDTATPVKVSIVTLGVNVLLSLFFIGVLKWGVWAIALSFSIMSFIDFMAMLYLLAKKLGGFTLSDLLIPFTKISYSALFMGILLYIPLKLLDELVFDTTKTVNLLLLTGIVSIAGLASYLFFTKLFRVEEIRLFYSALGRIRWKLSNRPGVVTSLSEE